MKAKDLILIGIVYLAYKRGLFAGLLSPQSQQRRDSSPSAPGVCPEPNFIPGQRYVAQMPDGMFAVVVNGAEYGRYSSQSCAEQTYNWLVCNGPKPSCT